VRRVRPGQQRVRMGRGSIRRLPELLARPESRRVQSLPRGNLPISARRARSLETARGQTRREAPLPRIPLRQGRPAMIHHGGHGGRGGIAGLSALSAAILFSAFATPALAQTDVVVVPRKPKAAPARTRPARPKAAAPRSRYGLLQLGPLLPNATVTVD